MKITNHYTTKRAVIILRWHYFVLIVIISVIYCFVLSACHNKHPEEKPFVDTAKDSIEVEYDITLLDNSEENKLIKYGYQVFKYSAKYLGPNNIINGLSYAGNNLSCGNCHLWSGTKPYAAPLIGIIQRFPQYRARENKIGTIEERINGCMERSMHGMEMPIEAKEMSGLLAYMKWLSKYSSEDGKVTGQGLVKIDIPDRMVNLMNGERVFETHCIVCHGRDGQGVKSLESFSYLYPPLWGADSYNNGAGMSRVITAAQFIKANMPFGTTYEAPVLTDEEAYDVAGYINQQPRPRKTSPEKDFPDLKKKPVSTPYPPHADTFKIHQHQLGPFPPIIKYYQAKYNIVKSK